MDQPQAASGKKRSRDDQQHSERREFTLGKFFMEDGYWFRSHHDQEETHTNVQFWVRQKTASTIATFGLCVCADPFACERATTEPHA